MKQKISFYNKIKALFLAFVTKRFFLFIKSISVFNKNPNIKKFEDYTTSDMKWKYEYPFQNFNQKKVKPSQKFWTQIDKKNQTS